MQVARHLGPGHTIVTVLCDRADRYAAKLYKVFEECGYEQKQDLEGMTKDEGRALMEAVEQRGKAHSRCRARCPRDLGGR